MASANAMIIGSGTDKDIYARGDKVTAFINIKNTGKDIIKDVSFTLSITKCAPLFGSSDAYGTDFLMRGVDIHPGEAKAVEVSERIPEGFHGASTKGKYALRIKVKVADHDIGSLNKTITVF